MSFIDLATLTMHRRQEMESRIRVLEEKCDQTEKSLKQLKIQSKMLVETLNCEPSELKERFLHGMQKLDEYIYLVTDMNLSLSTLEENGDEQSAVVSQEKCSPPLKAPPSQRHLLDILSDPLPSTSHDTPNSYRKIDLQKCKPKKPPKEGMLIAFSSNSCSEESMMRENRNKRVPSMETPRPEQPSPTLQLSQIKLEDMSEFVPRHVIDNFELPAQAVLQVDVGYAATITHIDGSHLWVIANDLNDVRKLFQEINEYYHENRVPASQQDTSSLPYCVYYDDETDCYFRCLQHVEEGSDLVHLFLVDTGEERTVSRDIIQPLARQYCDRPPYARCCSLAGIEWTVKTETIQAFLMQYQGHMCDIEIDDNSSEILGIYLTLQPENELLNHLVVTKDLACPAEDSKLEEPSPVKSEASSAVVQGPPELVGSELDITLGPELEDPLEAVTGYHNRDEEEICKHYKGGPEKTCFKGHRCKKRHVVLHPDGWTLDRVAVCARIASLPLPPPGALVPARVTCVASYNCVYVQLEPDEKPPKYPKRSFGVVLPPMTLDALVRDMNCSAGRNALRPLTLAPALGELVAALYPPDGQWYRARVQSLDGCEQSIQVCYVDYGTEMWIKENNLRELDEFYTRLPLQAVKCRLAGVESRFPETREWVRAYQELRDMVLDRTLKIRVIACEYDELVVELIDNDVNIAEELYSRKLIELRPYEIQDDSDVRHKCIVP